MGVFDAISGIVDQFTGKAGADAARKAAEAQTDALNRGIDVSRQQYQQGYSDLSGYRDAGGVGTQGMLAGLADPNSFYGYQFQQFDPNSIDVTQDPGYQFRLQQGMDAAMGSQAARGLSQSGGALKELQNYGQGLASQEYGNVYNRQYQNWQGNQAGQSQQAQLRAGALSGLAGMGLNATNARNQLGQNYAGQYMAGQQGIGDAQAAKYLGVQNSFAQGANNLKSLAEQIGKGAAAYYTGGLSGLAGGGAGGAGVMANSVIPAANQDYSGLLAGMR